MLTQVRKLLQALGFSKGCAEFAPKKPPPFVPKCLIGIIAATGPRNRLGLRLAVIARAHCAGLQRRDLRRACRSSARRRPSAARP